MLYLSDELVLRIRTHAAESYPHECCGAVLGTDSGSWREVLDLFPLVNRHNDSPRNRFVITPEDFRAAEQAARKGGLEVIGWYHSHPDHPARPSEYDREHAWPWYSYVIASVMQRLPKDMKSWRLKDDRTEFDEEEMEITPLGTINGGRVNAGEGDHPDRASALRGQARKR